MPLLLKTLSCYSCLTCWKTLVLFFLPILQKTLVLFSAFSVINTAFFIPASPAENMVLFSCLYCRILLFPYPASPVENTRVFFLPLLQKTMYFFVSPAEKLYFIPASPQKTWYFNTCQMHAETLSSSCLSADNTVFLSHPFLQETLSFYPRLLNKGQSVMVFLPLRRIHIHHISFIYIIYRIHGL